MKQTILIACLSFILGLFIGSVTKHVPECKPCAPAHSKTVNRVIEKARIEVKKETDETIKKIHNANTAELDSIWRDYAKRHGQDQP